MGAGYDPWLVFAAKIAQRNGINDITLVGVEADKERIDLMRAHFIKNGLPISEHDEIKTENQITTRCIYGGITESNEPLFYGANGIGDWGGQFRMIHLQWITVDMSSPRVGFHPIR